MNNEILSKELEKAIKNANKPIICYGASIFLEIYLRCNKKSNKNIIAIIDKNTQKQGKTIENIKIYSPDYLEKVNNAVIICTVINNHQDAYLETKSLIEKLDKQGNIKLMPSLFTNYESEKYKTLSDVTIIKPQDKDIQLLESLDDKYLEISEMQNLDRIFLTSLINKNKPKKLLEIGVAQGGSSIIMLNAIKDIKNSRLYSLDLLEYHYIHKDKKVGHFVDNYPDLKKKWTLKTGGLSLDFLDSISSSTSENDKFDFCFIDTAHRLPGEILDFLQVLPYLKRNAIVCLHDTNLQVFDPANAIATNLLMSAISGKRIIPYLDNKNKYTSSINTYVCNIGAIKLDNNAQTNLFQIFNLLTLRWDYSLKQKYITKLCNFYARHYGQYYADFFLNAVNIQKLMKTKINH